LSLLVIPTSPSILASQAGLPLDVYSMARLLASEGYGGPALEKRFALTQIGHAVKNEARRRGLSVTSLLTKSTYPEASGKYGEQRGRYASTSKAPKDAHLSLAQQVMAGTQADRTGGATKFLDPHVFQRGIQAGARLKPVEQVLTDWHEHNAYVGSIPGITTSYLMFFRPEKSAAKRKAALQVALADARASGGIVGTFVLLAIAGLAIWFLKSTKNTLS